MYTIEVFTQRRRGPRLAFSSPSYLQSDSLVCPYRWGTVCVCVWSIVEYTGLYWRDRRAHQVYYSVQEYTGVNWSTLDTGVYRSILTSQCFEKLPRILSTMGDSPGRRNDSRKLPNIRMENFPIRSGPNQNWCLFHGVLNFFGCLLSW